MFTTIRKVTELIDVTNGIGYKGEELPEYKDLYGRVIIKYHKGDRSQGRWFSGICDKLERIISKHKPDWINALSNQKAVYLITDTNNGKLYVGSATGTNGMLLQRWSNYVSNGHGGNIELKEVVDKNGFDYVKKYFTYTILENYNSRVEDNYILKRESWWKEVFQTRRFGYNKN